MKDVENVHHENADVTFVGNIFELSHKVWIQKVQLRALKPCIQLISESEHDKLVNINDLLQLPFTLTTIKQPLPSLTNPPPSVSDPHVPATEEVHISPA